MNSVIIFVIFDHVIFIYFHHLSIFLVAGILYDLLNASKSFMGIQYAVY